MKPRTYCSQQPPARTSAGPPLVGWKRKPNQWPLILGVLFLAACSAVATNCTSSTFVVTTTEDINDGQCDEAHCSLREAIIAANTCTVHPSYTIEVPEGTYDLLIRGPGDERGDLDITRDMEITGEESNLPRITGPASWNERIFEIHEGVTADLNHLWVRGGNSSSNGGGILNAGTLSLQRVIISDNVAGRSGGGIYNTGSVDMDFVELTENLANGSIGCGGGVFNLGYMWIEGSSIHRNDAQSGKGVCARGSSDGQLTIVDSYIIDNGGTYAGLGGLGGGISSIAAELFLDNTVVSRNYALYGGGAFASSGVIEIVDSEFDDNHALDGGGLYIGASAANVRVRGTIFSENLAQRALDRTGAWSGGLGGGVAIASDHFDFYQSPVVENRAEGMGGGIYIDAPGTTQGYFTHAPVAYNSNDYGPAGIAIVSGQLGLANATLSNNEGLGNGVAFYNGTNADSGFVHVTVADNSAVDSADFTRPIFNEDGGVLTFANSLLVGIGDDAACWGDTSGMTSRGGNVAAGMFLCASNNRVDDEDIPSVYRYGGRTYLPLTEIDGTLVHPLPIDSLAAEFIESPACNRDDQRLVVRPQGARCEAGAYELDAEALSITSEPILLATVTPTAGGPPMITLDIDANCRSGDSTSYRAVTSFSAGESFQIDGRNAATTWFWILMPQGGHCWIAASTGVATGLYQEVAIIVLPTATATATATNPPEPSATPTCSPNDPNCP